MAVASGVPLENSLYTCSGVTTVTWMLSRLRRWAAASRSASGTNAGGERITISVCGRACRSCAVTSPTISGWGNDFDRSTSTNSRTTVWLAGMENDNSEPLREASIRVTFTPSVTSNTTISDVAFRMTNCDASCLDCTSRKNV